tara:strand:+ start:1024 stop:1128 length:105 start_codon:yes stop_codon:yes gene_type:complete
MIEFLKCILWLEAFIAIQICLAIFLWAIRGKYRG